MPLAHEVLSKPAPSSSLFIPRSLCSVTLDFLQSDGILPFFLRFCHTFLLYFTASISSSLTQHCGLTSPPPLDRNCSQEVTHINNVGINIHKINLYGISDDILKNKLLKKKKNSFQHAFMPNQFWKLLLIWSLTNHLPPSLSSPFTRCSHSPSADNLLAPALLSLWLP